MLPGMVYQLEPYWVDFTTSPVPLPDFGDYLAKRGDGRSPSRWLAVTDDMAQKSQPRRGCQGVPDGARQRWQEHRGGAVPPSARLVQKYA